MIKADKLIVAPKEIDPIQAAMLKINPITAWRMLHDFVSLGPNEWFIQNAANSAPAAPPFKSDTSWDIAASM